MKATTHNNDKWVKDHFEQLVKKYAGQHIAVACGEVFSGEGAVEKARKKYPNVIPISMPVPAPEDFTHVLIITECPLPMSIGGVSFTATVGFSDRLGIGFNLLGRQSVFSRFDITFSDTSRSITFKPVHQY